MNDQKAETYTFLGDAQRPTHTHIKEDIPSKAWAGIAAKIRDETSHGCFADKYPAECNRSNEGVYGH